MPCVLAIDQSTSATKALLFDEDGICLDQESRAHRQYYPQPGWVEHDAEEIWQNVLNVSRDLVARNSQRATEIACISIANQRETIVIFDRATGRPLHPAIVWQCRRSDELCAAHRAAGHAELLHNRTGLHLDAYFSGSKLQWLVRNRPEIAVMLGSGKALIGTIDAYLVYRLNRTSVFATDHTNASRTLLYDINELRWAEELCTLWEVPVEALPEIRESEACFGETDLEGVLPKPRPIVGVMGDSQAALFAQRCFEPGMAKVTFGTGSSVLLNIGHEPRLSTRGLVTALAWVREKKPVYAFEGIIINSAATLSWLKSQLGLVRDVAEIEVLAGAIPDSGGVFLVPAFSGLGLPHWAPGARAAIVGLSAHSDRRHVARAALESMAYQLRDALDTMQAEGGVSLTALKADGGPTGNHLLMQLTADIAGVELVVSDVPNCSALGATLMGLLGLGFHSSLESIAATAHHGLIFRPVAPSTAIDEQLAGWRRAVRQVLAGLSEENIAQASK
jgi:glycerol kinase